MSIIFGIVAYVISGFIMRHFVRTYIRELQMKCWQMKDPGYDLFIYINKSSEVGYYIAMFVCGALWPITDIASVLHAEWVYSKKVEKFKGERAA